MNALVRVEFTIDVPEDCLEKLVGRPDDGSEEWYQDSADAAETWVLDNLPVALDLVANEPEVECVS